MQNLLLANMTYIKIKNGKKYIEKIWNEKYIFCKKSKYVLLGNFVKVCV